MNKLNIWIIMWWKTPEHKISLLSGKSIIENISKDKYNVLIIWVDTDWKWYLMDSNDFLLNTTDPTKICLSENKIPILLDYASWNWRIIWLTSDLNLKIDVAFPIIHWNYGEDWSIQWLLKLADIPFVWSGVLGCSVWLDKEMTKRILRDNDIPVSDFLIFNKEDKSKIDFESIVNKLWLPFFIKSANTWSSVGVHKVFSNNELKLAIEDSFKYDNKILCERYIKWREIEVSILWYWEIQASLPWEIVVWNWHEFYSYQAKYIDENWAKVLAPVNLPNSITKRIQQIAINTFKAVWCEWYARVDVFMQENWSVFVNEINTIPWFTKISMYPKLWQVTGLDYPNLLEKLIELAIQRYNDQKTILNEFII